MQLTIPKGNNLHNDIKYFIKVAQLFGMFPLCNVLQDKHTSIAFSWKCPWTCYAILMTFSTFILTTASLIRMCINDFKLHLLDSFVFCMNASFIQLAFFQIAMNWSKILNNFNRTAAIFRNCSYQRNCKLLFGIVLSLTASAIMLEHSLAVANTYVNIEPGVYMELNRTHLEQYFREEYPFIFDYIPYSLLLGLLVSYVNICNVFSWSFIDSFIMMISYVLAYRFKQVHYNIKNGINRKYDSKLFWAKMREDYSQLAILCQKVNKTMANVIIVSFGANIYFIVTQLYKGLVTRRTIVDQCYFMYSFGILLVRTTSVTFFSSMVHSQSKKPLSYLICVRNEMYNDEIKRFILQIRSQDTSLSGGEYFMVTRGLLFQMAAIVITYELFLIQTGINIYL